MRFHLERKTGAIAQTAEQGLRGYDLFVTHLVYTVIPVIVEFVAVTLVMLHFNHASYLLIFGVAALAYVIAFYRWARAIQEPSESITSALIESGAVLNDSLLNAETVKYFDAEKVVARNFDKALAKTESAGLRFFNRYAAHGILVALIFASSLGVSLLCATRDVLQGAMTAGDFVLINMYVMRLVQPLELLGFAVRDIAQGLAYLGAMLRLFKERAEESGGRPAASIESKGELRFENVTFSYRPSKLVLRDVSFCVPAGKTTAIVGMSGSGKSSLIRLMFRLYEPNSGRILLDGMPISQMSLAFVRRAIAIVPQDTVLLNASINANLSLARVGCTRFEVEDAARVANLHDFIMGLPEEYETEVGERGLKLSGGERQRVAIARAVLKQPRIAVFDEATSSLDSRTEREILRNLGALSKRCTTLVIAHRLSTVTHADEILVLSHGVVVERGTHDALRASGGHYARLWDAQHDGSCDREDSNSPALPDTEFRCNDELGRAGRDGGASRVSSSSRRSS
jgi:ATP-binding cassette subfamily B protein